MGPLRAEVAKGEWEIPSGTNPKPETLKFRDPLLHWPLSTSIDGLQMDVSGTSWGSGLRLSIIGLYWGCCQTGLATLKKWKTKWKLRHYNRTHIYIYIHTRFGVKGLGSSSRQRTFV